MNSSEPSIPTSLDAIDVAAPCTESWDAMTGDDRSRFCGLCRLHVYDLSSMTRDEAHSLVASRKRAGERLCVRFVRRADGTVVTDDCGPVRRALRRRALRVRAAAVGALAFLFPMTACGRDPPAAAPAEAKPIESKPPVMPGASGRTAPAPCAPQNAPPAPPKAPDAVAPPSPTQPQPPTAPEPPRTETIGKI